MRRLMVAAAALALLAGCGSSAEKPDGLRVGTGGEADQVFVTAATSAEDEVREVVQDAVDYLDDTADAGGYFIQVSCEGSGDPIGTARFALGNLGAAQLDLDEGDYAFKFATSTPDC